jgi:hypothetical protein
MRNIKIDASAFLLDCLMDDDDAPTADSLKELVYTTAVSTSWNELPDGLLEGLVRAYVAQATHEAFDEAEMDDDGSPDFELVSGNDAEAIYRKFIIAGYRAVLKGKEEFKAYLASESDSGVFENCDWYEPVVKCWPDQLLAEVAYAKGRRTAREAIAMSEYFRAHRASEKTA